MSYKYLTLLFLLTPKSHAGFGELLSNKIQSAIVNKALKKVDPYLEYVLSIQPMTAHDTVAIIPSSIKSLLVQNPSSSKGNQSVKCHICNSDKCDNRIHTTYYTSTLAEGLIKGTATALTLHYLLKQSEQNGLAAVALQLGINALAYQGVKHYFNEAFPSKASKVKQKATASGVKWGIKTALLHTPGINKEIMKSIILEKHKMQSFVQGTLINVLENAASTGLHRVSPAYATQKLRIQHSKKTDYAFFQIPKTIGFILGGYLAYKYLENPINDLSHMVTDTIKDYTPHVLAKMVAMTR